MFSPDDRVLLRRLRFGPPRNPCRRRTVDGDRRHLHLANGRRGARAPDLRSSHRTPVTWTRAPDGVIAIEDGGQIELVDMAGSVVGVDDRHRDQPEHLAGLVSGWLEDRFAGAGQRLRSVRDERGRRQTASGSPRSSVTSTRLRGRRTGTGSPSGSTTGEIRTGLSGLATVSPDGSGWTELVVRDRERVESPAWSPDGTGSRSRSSRTRDRPAYVVDADGWISSGCWTEPGVVAVVDTRRTADPASRPTIRSSPCGRTASGERVFLADPPADGVLVVDWSPDGRWIVLLPANGSQARRRSTSCGRTGARSSRSSSARKPSWRPGSDDGRS